MSHSECAISFSGGSSFHNSSELSMQRVEAKWSEEQEELKMQIYPNPVGSSPVSIRIEGKPTTTLKIYTLSGRLVYEQAMDQMDSPLRLEHLRAGTYVVHLESKDQVLTQKLIVLDTF